jgi:hypothetical protein
MAIFSCFKGVAGTKYAWSALFLGVTSGHMNALTLLEVPDFVASEDFAIHSDE